MPSDPLARARARRWLSREPAATERLGEALGRAATPGLTLGLRGPLGAGKTCFVRGLARGLGVTERVTSPTYALLQTYPGRLELAHLDAWMEGRERAFLGDGGLEWLERAGVIVVEWADRVEDLLPLPRLQLDFEHRGEALRAIELWVVGESGALDELVRALPRVAGLDELADSQV
jgi:tRNA threonylcarbamoyladenosine biosynthesis protein TsaE